MDGKKSQRRGSCTSLTTQAHGQPPAAPGKPNSILALSDWALSLMWCSISLTRKLAEGRKVTEEVEPQDLAGAGDRTAQKGAMFLRWEKLRKSCRIPRAFSQLEGRVSAEAEHGMEVFVET